jgi:hypothetical protein
MSDEELTPISVGHLKAIQRHPDLFQDSQKLDAIIEAILDIETQILKLIREVKFLRDGSP